jgi:hypothetical protein
MRFDKLRWPTRVCACSQVNIFWRAARPWG